MQLTKFQTNLMWTLSFLLSALFLFAGSMKLMGAPDSVAGFEHFGYPQWFRIVIGLIEVLGAIGLLIPRIAAQVGSYLILVMLGAVISHLRAGDAFPNVLTALVVLFAVGGVTTLRGEQP